MKIIIIAEGKTEQVFKRSLLKFLNERLCGKMPKIDFRPQNGMIPRNEKLKELVERILKFDKPDCVIALTDVYTGGNDFKNASDAKEKMRSWVENNPKFYPHAAQYEFEAWLLPYWSTIQKMSGSNRAEPSSNPENVNHGKPPSRLLREVFETKGNKSYVKTRDAQAILANNDLSVAISRCHELRALVNTIIKLCGGYEI